MTVLTRGTFLKFTNQQFWGRVIMKQLKPFLLAVVVLLLVSGAFAQFVEVQVEISVDRLPEKERADLKMLEQAIPAYFENYNWIENVFGIQIPLRISIYPQSVNTTGSERIFTAQIFVTNEAVDMRFFEKNFKFVYNTNDPVIHTEMIQTLTGTLDFYAYMMIASELDTYEPLGGNAVYEKARDVATRGQMSERPVGWKNRLQDLDEILRLRHYRMMKYHFWGAMDLADQGKKTMVTPEIDKALQALESMFAENARERYSHIFLDAHARDLMTIIRDMGTEAQAQKLMALDPDNKTVYEKIISSKKP
ncbi:MAG: DUF4835 family protein [Candidatus Marinimicrobia bacterium]|nr:DUF4835 family protein [Candidatus Neomarinimicrobiota bacterium]